MAIPDEVAAALQRLVANNDALREARGVQAEKAAALALAVAEKAAAEDSVNAGVAAVKADYDAAIAAINAAFPDAAASAFRVHGATVGECQAAPQGSTIRNAAFVELNAEDPAEEAAGRFIRAAVFVVARLRGWNRQKVERALSHMKAERPWLDWLKNGGLEQILAFIAAILKFAA